MTVATKLKRDTLGNYAYQAFEKHFKKILKWEKAVKQDKDPEALHQMRIGMRRLRSSINGFSLGIVLPKNISNKSIGKISRRLGQLRDLDVLKETLENVYQPHLPPKEKELLTVIFKILNKQRDDAVNSVKSTLKDESYKSLKESLRRWLEEPSYQDSAALAIHQVVPDLLLPEVSHFLLHPGWLIGTQIEHTDVVVLKDWKAQKIEQMLTTGGENLHDLRKQAKRLRYQMELFPNLYDDNPKGVAQSERYKTHLAEVKKVQDILGQLNDSVVLADWLSYVCKSKLQKKLPTLANLIEDRRYRLWEEWQFLQEVYIKPETKQDFRLTILHPCENQMSDDTQPQVAALATN